MVVYEQAATVPIMHSFVYRKYQLLKFFNVSAS